jgi:integrase
LARVTGTLITVDRNDGPVVYIKARDRAGRQIKKRLGPESDWSRRKREDALREFLVDLGRTPGGPDHDITVADASHAWLAYVEHEKARATSTVRDYRNTVKSSILPHFGKDVPLRSIDTDAVDEFRRVLLERVSRRTAQKTLVILFGLLKYAKRRRWITENPAEFAEKVSVTSSGEFNVLEPEQVQAVSRAAENDQMAALFLVGAFTGLRCPGELRALRWRQLDFHNRIVHVVKNYVLGQEGVTKGKRVRSVPLSDQALVALDGLSRRPRFTAHSDLVFCTEAGGHLTGDSIRDAFYVALNAAGLGHLREKDDPIVPYDLRHTFGTLAVRTAPLTDVQSWMGHQDIQTTMRYVHYVPRHDAAAKLTAAFNGLPDPKAGTERVPTGTKMSGSDVSEGT